jgi:YHS domain-containing protein
MCTNPLIKEKQMAIDPVCAMTVDEKNPPGGSSEYKGQKYYFCSRGCKVAFDKNPEKYLNAKPGEHGGMMGHQ